MRRTLAACTAGLLLLSIGPHGPAIAATVAQGGDAAQAGTNGASGPPKRPPKIIPKPDPAPPVIKPPPAPKPKPKPKPEGPKLAFAGIWTLHVDCGFTFTTTLVIDVATKSEVRGQTLLLLGHGAVLSGSFSGTAATFLEQYPADHGQYSHWVAELSADGKAVSGHYTSDKLCTFSGTRRE